MTLSDASRMFLSCYYFFLSLRQEDIRFDLSLKGYLLFIQKINKKWIQFLNILFLIQLGRRRNVLQDSLKNQRKPLKTRCTFVSNVVATIYFQLQNRSGLLMREHLYSMSVVIVTIDGGMDNTHYAINLQLKFSW